MKGAIFAPRIQDWPTCDSSPDFGSKTPTLNGAFNLGLQELNPIDVKLAVASEAKVNCRRVKNKEEDIKHR